MQGHGRELVLRIQEPWGRSGVWLGGANGREAACPWGNFLSGTVPPCHQVRNPRQQVLNLTAAAI